MPKYPVSDHCDGERFFNPYENARPLSDVIKWARTRQRTPWPSHVPLQPRDPPPTRVDPGRVAVTFIGHSTFLLRTASSVILTDPVFTTHAGPFGRLGPARVRPPGIAATAVPPVDIVLVSHNHYDHLQPSSLRRFWESATFVAPLGVGGQLGLPPERKIDERRPERRKIHELDWWQTTRIGDAEITCVPAQHFSARTPWDRNRTLWCGYVVRVDGVVIYFAADTGYTPQFKQIGERCPSIDLALLPIGAYEPRWFMSPIHMNPEEAVRAHQDVCARLSIGMHFGTFQLTDEGIDEPLRALDQAKASHGVKAESFRTLEFGESVVV